MSCVRERDAEFRAGIGAEQQQIDVEPKTLLQGETFFLHAWLRIDAKREFPERLAGRSWRMSTVGVVLCCAIGFARSDASRKRSARAMLKISLLPMYAH